MISESEVKHIAKLARLELTAQELKKMQKDLSSILDYFDLLKKADTSKVKGQAPLRLRASEGQTRIDEASVANQDLTKKIVEAFPDKKDNYIKVKAIL
ncbi:MAG: Asp-tRNA(Asn)/Glu-tRNA(Gln) amidotransferase subunit GatC [Candidatus Staskawiczbacteria bacterium]|nr:Asp-tRNA(Asn)/Glu-tRNA(Gln) amidotransferase subunit GatC [Candidatus Staskawiczbacteria bacterium]